MPCRYLAARRGGVDLGVLGVYANTDPWLFPYAPLWLSNNAKPQTPSHGTAAPATMGLGGRYSAAGLRMAWNPPQVLARSRRRGASDYHPHVRAETMERAPSHTRFFRKQPKTEFMVAPTRSLSATQLLLHTTSAGCSPMPTPRSIAGSTGAFRTPGPSQSRRTSASSGRARSARGSMSASRRTARSRGSDARGVAPLGATAMLAARSVVDGVVSGTDVTVPLHLTTPTNQPVQLGEELATQDGRHYASKRLPRRSAPAVPPQQRAYQHVLKAYASASNGTAAAQGGHAAGAPASVSGAAAARGARRPASAAAGKRRAAVPQGPGRQASARGGNHGRGGGGGGATRGRDYFAGAWDAATYAVR